MEMTDYELISKIVAGNTQLFSELVTRYKKLIYSVVYNMISDKQDVNDISQEVFIRIYKSLSRYNPEFKFSTWSVKIATNLCLDVIRKKKVESMPIEEIEGFAGDSDTPEEKLLMRERSKNIRKAIDELPDKYKIPILLFHQNGLSYEEMTKVLNEPMSIIKNRLYRARLMLRERLMEDRKEEVL